MQYNVRITPGRNIIEPEELDVELKKGCDEAANYGTNIYVYGKTGCGKTSVLEYFKSKAWDYFGVNESEILFMTAFEFVDEIIDGIRTDRISDFKRKYYVSRLVIIDDIDFLAGKEATQCKLLEIIESSRIVIFSGSKDVRGLGLSDEIVNKIKNFTLFEINENYERSDEKYEQMIFGNFNSRTRV